MTPERKQTIIASAALTVHWLLILDLLDNLGQSAPSGDARSWLPPVPQALTDFLTERLGAYLDTVKDLDEVDDEDFGTDLAHHLRETGGESGYFNTKGAPRTPDLEYGTWSGNLYLPYENERFIEVRTVECPEVEAFILSME